jgi:hypothetical protein
MEHINVATSAYGRIRESASIGSVPIESLQQGMKTNNPLFCALTEKPVVWSVKEGGLGTSGDSSRPIVVVISDSTRQIERDIKNHYSDQDYSRWDRLEQNQTVKSPHSSDILGVIC